MHWTTILIHILILLQMILVNLMVVCTYSKLKIKIWKGVIIFVVFTAALLGLTIPLMTLNPNYGDGNGLFIFLGALYLLPCKLFFDQSTKRTMVILFTSWIYTALVFTLSVQTAYLFLNGYFEAVVLIAQTVLYIITIPLFYLFVRKPLNVIYENMQGKVVNDFLSCSLSLFIAVVFVNYAFVKNLTAFNLIALLWLAVCAGFCINVIFNLVRTAQSSREMTVITYNDPITNLPNNNKFYADMYEFFASARNGILIFIDLDHFKRINDLYGHPMGDKYLKEFGNYLQEHFKENERVYRLYGDEFTILSTSENTIEKITKCQQEVLGLQINGNNFLGFSFGYVLLPEQGATVEEAIKNSDRNMYKNKIHKDNRIIVKKAD